jgi:cell division septation protein DedD
MRVMPNQFSVAAMLLAGLAVLGLGGCGGREPDQEDELGTTEDGRYELVMVAPQPTPAPTPARPMDTSVVAEPEVTYLRADSTLDEAPEDLRPEQPSTGTPAARDATPRGEQTTTARSEAESRSAAIGQTAPPPSRMVAPKGTVAYDPRGEFTVQIAVVPDTRAARNLVRELTAEGYPAYSIPSPGAKGVRVRIGYFTSRDDALRFGALFKQDRGMESWVDRRANER